MDESRRGFLKKAGCAALGIGGGLPLLRAGAETFDGLRAPAGKQWAMVVDVRKCLSEEVRRAAVEACHREHNVPEISDPKEEVKWLWAEAYESAFPDGAHSRVEDALKGKPVLVLCNHCARPACVKVCPTQATWKRKQDGLVMMDYHRCIGCRDFIGARPYGGRGFNWRDPRPHLRGGVRPPYPTRSKGVVEKCTFCDERLREGRPPACVEAAGKVPGGDGALAFGDLSDPGSEVSRILRQRHSVCRRVGLGTGPNVYYLV